MPPCCSLLVFWPSPGGTPRVELGCKPTHLQQALASCTRTKWEHLHNTWSNSNVLCRCHSTWSNPTWCIDSHVIVFNSFTSPGCLVIDLQFTGCQLSHDALLSIYSSQDVSFHMVPSYRFAGCQIPHTQMIPIIMKQSPHSARTDERQFNIFQQS